MAEEKNKSNIGEGIAWAGFWLAGGIVWAAHIIAGAL